MPTNRSSSISPSVERSEGEVHGKGIVKFSLVSTRRESLSDASVSSVSMFVVRELSFSSDEVVCLYWEKKEYGLVILSTASYSFSLVLLVLPPSSCSSEMRFVSNVENKTSSSSSSSSSSASLLSSRVNRFDFACFLILLCLSVCLCPDAMFLQTTERGREMCLSIQ